MKSSDFELLLPVGQKEMAIAAVQNGADAIYVGFPGFNARGRSYDFERDELKQMIEYCHLNGVRVNLAFNILIFENELERARQALEEILPLKPDALIIQDLGLAQWVRELYPDQVLHASTQMTVTNELAIELLQDLEINRFVLGRENSLDEIRMISEKSNKDLEVFVHGALCVSYSGQCFTSETLGGRSANRGQCAQSCRFEYDLIVDGEVKSLGGRRYLVSPQDLCGIAEIPELMKLGVKSFKVEGRLKSPDYVAQVAKSYRRAIDQTLNQEQLNLEKNKMAVEYSRGFFPGWLHGVNHQKLVEGTFSSHRGLEIGKVVSVQQNVMVIEKNVQDLNLENGDGVLWFEGQDKRGDRIFSVNEDEKYWDVEFSNATVLSQTSLGSKVYLNHDRSQKRALEKQLTDRSLAKRIAVKVKLSLQEGKPLKADVWDDRFHLELETESVLVKAQSKPLRASFLFEEFSALSGTVFQLKLEDFEMETVDGQSLFLHHRDIKNLRQKLFAKLGELRSHHPLSQVQKNEFVMNQEFNSTLTPRATSGSLKLNLLFREKLQVDTLIKALESQELKRSQIHSVTLDFEFGRDYRSSVEILKTYSIPVGIATTRILKPQEYGNLKVIHALSPDFILVRNLGALYYFQKVQKFSGELKGDFSLNVTNHKTFEYLRQKGLSTLCLSYDLNFEQTVDLLKQVDSGRAEITLHQSMPSFHMEHCVFAAFLSQGTSYRDCGKPCEKHKVQLKDQFGNTHWIKPDHECRNTMFNASAQTALPYLDAWKAQGLGEIRFEALHETGSELIEKIQTYVQILSGEITIEEGLKSLKAQESYGLSPRQLGRQLEYQPRKKDHSFLPRV